MKQKGFTLVEVIMVIALIAIVLALAAPNIFKFGDRANEKALKTKIDNLAKITEQYVENNSNDIVYRCINHDGCICTSFTSSSPDYICTFSIRNLLSLRLYNEKCNTNSGTCICQIADPTNSNNCLENKSFSVKINLNSNSAIATFIN